MVGKLQRGECVTLEDGTVVRPEQVLDEVHTEKRPFLGAVEMILREHYISLTHSSTLTNCFYFYV